MINLANIDQTQAEVSRHLVETERLLCRAVSQISGRSENAELLLLPDLGMPHSVRRVMGGFFTGMMAHWTCAEPFVPIDATVNVCAVGVYRLKHGPIEAGEWLTRIDAVRKASEVNCSYKWNFDIGNHFITLAKVGVGESIKSGFYLVLHSSAAEFKSQRNGLYPTVGNWYADQIELVESQESGRYLRYLRGVPAERFFRQAELLVPYNRNRLHYFAEQIAGGGSIEEVLYLPHYGMPDSQSVAIGCQWLTRGSTAMLLTAPGEDLLLVEPDDTGENCISIDGRPHLLMPHGLGVAARGVLQVDYRVDGVQVNNQHYSDGASLQRNGELTIRGTPNRVKAIVQRLLELCPGRISARLCPFRSYPA